MLRARDACRAAGRAHHSALSSDNTPCRFIRFAALQAGLHRPREPTGTVRGHGAPRAQAPGRGEVRTVTLPLGFMLALNLLTEPSHPRLVPTLRKWSRKETSPRKPEQTPTARVSKDTQRPRPQHRREHLNRNRTALDLFAGGICNSDPVWAVAKDIVGTPYDTLESYGPAPPPRIRVCRTPETPAPDLGMA
jgi:hypothetical protein